MLRKRAKLVKTKMDLVLKKNKGFKIILKIHNIINDEYKTEEEDFSNN
jgi:hypothetical protein